MRKLKLQMITSIDGFVKADREGGENITWDEEALQFCTDNLEDVDCILLGRNTAEVFIPHWAEVAKNDKDNDHELGKIITALPKVVASKTITATKWENTTVINGNIAEEIQQLKSSTGRNIIVYGGYTFVTSLIEHGLIDEYYLLVGPVAYGTGKPIFNALKDNLHLKLTKCYPFPAGIVLMQYENKIN